VGWPEGFRIHQSIFPFYNIILPLAEKSIKNMPGLFLLKTTRENTKSMNISMTTTNYA